MERQNDLNINTDPPTKEEIAVAIKTLKSGKAADIDEIQLELLKVDLSSATNVFHNLFNNIWAKYEIPNEWTKGLIVKLP